MILTKRGFTLIEVLIAAGLLIMVASSITTLNNHLIQGTVKRADVSVANRLAVANMEKLLNAKDTKVATRTADGVWFEQAKTGTDFGFYKPNLEKLTSNKDVVFSSINTTITDSQSKSLLNGITYYGFICIEKVGAVNSNDKSKVSCDTSIDSVRSPVYTDKCSDGDSYCKMVKDTNDKKEVIQPGNAVKIRSIVVWQAEEGVYETVDIASIITNWKGLQ